MLKPMNAADVKAFDSSRNVRVIGSSDGGTSYRWGRHLVASLEGVTDRWQWVPNYFNQ
jgi:hypothetical protein